MSKFRILHVDDEADIREVVAIALSLDPDFVSRSCATGEEALAQASSWMPDLVLMDVMMPAMDGPETLARLRESPDTAEIPVVFMTARAQSRELDRLESLGAVGVIPKPFDPMTLAASVKAHIVPSQNRLDTMRGEFLQRFESDLMALSGHWLELWSAPSIPTSLSAIKTIAHGLAGAGGIFGFPHISDGAAKLEDAVRFNIDGSGTMSDVGQALAGLMAMRGKRCEFWKGVRR